jgi:hypothetical protein
MNLFKNKTFSIIIMIVMIIASILIGSHRSLTGLSVDASNVFISGANGDGMGIQNDLNQRFELSGNLVKITDNYIDINNSIFKTISDARSSLTTAETPKEKYNANIKLTEAVNELYTLLGKENLSDKDERYRNSIYSDFCSRNDTIGHDKYNEYAKKFNDTLKQFPANILSKLTFVKPLELFQ